MHSANAEPALSAQGSGADEPNGDQAAHRDGINRNQQWFQAQQWKLGCHQSDHNSNSGGNPVVVPVGVISLALGACDQEARHRDHGEGDTPQHWFLESPAFALPVEGEQAVFTTHRANFHAQLIA